MAMLPTPTLWGRSSPFQALAKALIGRGISHSRHTAFARLSGIPLYVFVRMVFHNRTPYDACNFLEKARWLPCSAP